MKIFTKIILTILLFLISMQAKCFAEEHSGLPSFLNQYVQISSIPSHIKMYRPKERIEHFTRIIFINPRTQQLFSFCASRYMFALREKKLTEAMHRLAKGEFRTKNPNYQERIVSFKILKAHNQDIPYLITNEYYKKRLAAKGVCGIIPNYNGKAIVIESYAPPSKFSEQAFINFFSNIKFKPDTFD